MRDAVGIILLLATTKLSMYDPTIQIDLLKQKNAVAGSRYNVNILL